MDTRFWGPSAWKLLHMATFKYNPKTQKEDMLTFLSLLPFVLPCKFCRKSLTEYYAADPPSSAMASPATLSRWLWRIHNDVNDKLRVQGQAIAPNPSYKAVEAQYTAYLQEGCSRTQFPGWELLFCILDNHPLSKEGRQSKPISDEAPTTPDDLEKNRLNLLNPEERLTYVVNFFEVLPHILPYREWEQSWIQHAGPIRDTPIAKGRKRSTAWLYNIRKHMETEFELKNKDTYFGVCSTVAAHRSGCSTSKRARTCRKSRKN